MSNDRYQAPMANGQDHPLKEVPQRILDAAREVVDDAAGCGDIEPSLSHPLADAVVMALLERGYLHSRCHDCNEIIGLTGDGL